MQLVIYGGFYYNMMLTLLYLQLFSIHASRIRFRRKLASKLQRSLLCWSPTFLYV